MAIDAVRVVGGAGSAGVSAQEEYRYELLQRLRRRALERRRQGAKDSGGRRGDGDGPARRGAPGAEPRGQLPDTGEPGSAHRA